MTDEPILTDEQRLMATGLLTVAASLNAQLRAIERALSEITGEDPDSLIGSRASEAISETYVEAPAIWSLVEQLEQGLRRDRARAAEAATS